MIAEPKVILLVEDDPNDVDLTLRVLRRTPLGKDIVVARDGVEALDYLLGTGSFSGRDPSELPQVILLDLHLPMLSGLEVLKRIRSHEQTRRVPVVILTSSNADQDKLAGYDLGANGYVRKPIDFAQFSEAVDHVGQYWLRINQPPPT
jgi:CheY-like chemotaxis protein